MKAFIRLFRVAVFSLILSGRAWAQEATEKKELLLQTNELTAYNVHRISNQLSALEGVHFCGYFSKEQTLLITYETEKIMDPSIIINTIIHLNHGMCIEVVEGDSIFAYIDKYDKD